MKNCGWTHALLGAISWRRRVCERRGAEMLARMSRGQWRLHIGKNQVLAWTILATECSTHLGTYVSQASWEQYELPVGGRLKVTTGSTVTAAFPNGSIASISPESVGDSLALKSIDVRRMEALLRRIWKCAVEKTATQSLIEESSIEAGLESRVFRIR